MSKIDDEGWGKDEVPDYDTEGGKEDLIGKTRRVDNQGFRSENKFENGVYTDVDPVRYKTNKKIRNGKFPGCEAPSHRRYAPALFTVDFNSNHPKYNGKTDLCELHYDQEKHDVGNIDFVSPIGNTEDARNEARSDAAIRRITQRNRIARLESTRTGTLSDSLATPGRPAITTEDVVKQSGTSGGRSPKAPTSLPKMGEEGYDWSADIAAAEKDMAKSKRDLGVSDESSDWDKE